MPPPFPQRKIGKWGIVKHQGFLRKPVVVNNDVNRGLNPDTTDSKVKGTKGRLRILLLSLKVISNYSKTKPTLVKKPLDTSEVFWQICWTATTRPRRESSVRPDHVPHSSSKTVWRCSGTSNSRLRESALRKPPLEGFRRSKILKHHGLWPDARSMILIREVLTLKNSTQAKIVAGEISLSKFFIKWDKNKSLVLPQDICFVHIIVNLKCNLF